MKLSHWFRRLLSVFGAGALCRLILLIITSPIFIIPAWIVHFIRLIMAGLNVESES